MGRNVKELRNIARLLLRRFDLKLTRYSAYSALLSKAVTLEENGRASDDLKMLQTFPREDVGRLVQYLPKSHSQLRQDLFVLSQLDFKSDGFFVEFGATNGVELSNSYLLETDFNWRGILAEPARCWQAALKQNRRATIENMCVWKNTGSTLEFNEAASSTLSTINSFSSGDMHDKAREDGKLYNVQTISLNDLLDKYEAPSDIDYLSIDTEGSEYEILNALDFSRHSFKVITCEHNFTPARKRIFELLSANGYQRVYQEISKFDDWYVRGGLKKVAKID